MAQYWYEKAAEQGHHQAQYELGYYIDKSCNAPNPSDKKTFFAKLWNCLKHLLHKVTPVNGILRCCILRDEQ